MIETNHAQSIPVNPELYPMTTFNLPKISNYTCYMFGNRPGGMGMVYTPVEGKVPNRFVRFMMRICLGCTWVKTNK